MGPDSFVWQALSSALGRPPGVALLAAVAGAFLLGGVVKGTLGVGLPLVIVPVLALMIPSPKAIALMGIPILSSNVWQAFDGGRLRESVRRFGPLMATLVVSTALTARITLGLPVDVLNALVAGALVLAIVLMTWNPRLDIDARGERRWGLLVGLLSGALGGVSSMMGPIVIVYLLALRLPAEQFIGSISVIYLAGALPLYLSMAALDVLGLPELLLSGLALLPMFAGMALGKQLRRHVSEDLFRRLLLGFLSVVALLLVTK